MMVQIQTHQHQMMTLDQSSTTMMICYLLRRLQVQTLLLQYLEETGQQVQYTITTDTTTETSTQWITAITSDSSASNLFDATYVMNKSHMTYTNVSTTMVVQGPTVEPTGNKSTSVFSTGDSYKWKYMYSLTVDEQTNFLSTDFMHVSTESTDYSTTTNAIEHVKITELRTGSATNGNIHKRCNRVDGSSGTVTVTVSGNAVTAVTITGLRIRVTHLQVLKQVRLVTYLALTSTLLFHQRVDVCYRRCKRTWWILCNDEC